jgi:activator of HSP90 ATPase
MLVLLCVNAREMSEEYLGGIMSERAISNSNLLSRREFSGRLGSLLSTAAIAGTAFGNTRAQDATGAGSATVVSHTAESIHQEVVFKASPARVYAALTDGAQFTKATALLTDMAEGPAEISRDPGGPFVLFGGRILGRHVELVPNERIVQAWRAASWDEGIYSIAKFVLKEEVAGTRIVFDHTGFPVGDGEHLASGWKAHYWEPLEKYFAS